MNDLRSVIGGTGVTIVPSVFDALGAMIARHVGFTTISVSGNGVSAALLGRPDLGLLTMSEAVNQTRNIVAAAPLSVIADADNGYGGPVNTYRAVREFGLAGVAAVHVEDQQGPKRCAYLEEPPSVVSIAEAVERIKAARRAADETGIVLIARCDAYRRHGNDEVLRRAEAYADAGADMFFSANVGSLDDVRAISGVVEVPLMVNMNASSPIAGSARQELDEAGARLALFPSIARNAVVGSVLAAFRKLHSSGDMSEFDFGQELANAASFDEVLETAHWAGFEGSLS